jgi:murein L,D-transpeptidase YafK
MVHGGCSSAGCFAVTNEVVDEIWRIVTAALGEGQQRFQVQSFPFRMTEANLALYQGHRWHGFWRELKPGSDLLEATGVPPAVRSCNGRYTFLPGTPGTDGSATIENGCASPMPASSQDEG